MFFQGKLVFLLWILIFCLSSNVGAEEIPEITVTATRGGESLTSSSVDDAQIKLDSVPGGTTLVTQEQVREGVTRSLQEALAVTPGVYARSRFGSGEVRLSIRGSGVTQTFNARGVRILRDGLPISEADGNVRPQLIETLNAQHIEVYKGANALEYGAATLGGAINIVSPNARNQERSFSRLEVGSDNYLRGQAAHGWILDNGWDLYTSLTGIEQNGFRENSEQETVRFYGNVGKRWHDHAESRVHLSWQDNNIELPGSLTEDQFEDDPSQANAGSLRRNSQRDFNVFRLTGQHSINFGNNAKADFGINYQYLDMFHPLPFALLTADEHDLSFSARVTQTLTMFSNNHNLVYGSLASYGEDKNGRFRYEDPEGEARGSRSRDDENEAWGIELFAQDTIEMTDRTDLIFGAQVVYAERDFSETPVSSLGVEGDTISDRASYFGISPRVGVTMQLNDKVQLFGNISRSFEPPTTGEFSVPLDSGDAEVLDSQVSTTFEIGSRGNISDDLRYEIAVYYADLNDEILFQEDPTLPSGSGFAVTLNADDTVHSGVEFGINGKVLPNLDLVAHYTYTNLEFDNDDTFGNNDIPGIPDHTFRAELIYRNNNGFYIGPTMEYSSDWYVDFENTASTESYTIWGAKAGYVFNDRMRLFFEAVNLEDDDYISNTAITAFADDDTAVFNPGLERSLFGGLEIRM
jgi:iron complex outermembrane receptor protein